MRRTLRLLQLIDWAELDRFDFFHLIGFLKSAASSKPVREFVSINFQNIILYLIKYCPGPEQLPAIKGIFEDFDLEYDDFLILESNTDSMQQCIDGFFESEIYIAITELAENAIYIEFVNDEKKRFTNVLQEQYDLMGILDNVYLSQF